MWAQASSPVQSQSMNTRVAKLEDAEAIARLVNAAFRPERFFSDGDRTNPNKVSELLHKGKFLLVEETGKLVGCIYVELRGDRGYFGLLAVEPALQRSGLGSRMVAAAEDYCRAANCRFMDLTIVNLRTELPAFYHRLGYIENGTLPFPERPTHEPALSFGKDVKSSRIVSGTKNQVGQQPLAVRPGKAWQIRGTIVCDGIRAQFWTRSRGHDSQFVEGKLGARWIFFRGKAIHLDPVGIRS